MTADTSAIEDADGLEDVSYEYQWIAGGTDIDGATSSSYELSSSEQGQTIQVRVTFTDDAENEESLTSVATEAVTAAPNREATGQPTISGTPQLEQTLTASTSDIDDEDGLTNVSYSYQWIAGGSDIAGATGSTYTLTASEQGQTVQVRVTFTDDADNEETLTSEATEAVAAKPNSEATGEPVIGGTPQVGETLTADTANIVDQDGLTNVSYSYQWIAGGTDIDGATSSTHTLTASEQGQTIQVRVTFTDDADNEETLTSEATVAVATVANREATGQPTISGTPQVGQTLTADTANIIDQDGLTGVSYTYQWIAGGTDIDGATSSTHTLTASEQGQTIQVRVTFTDDADNEETLTSEATAEVTAAPVPLTVSVTVSAPASHDGLVRVHLRDRVQRGVRPELQDPEVRRLQRDGRVRGEGAENGQAQQHSLAHNDKAARQRGRDHRAPGNHGLQCSGGHLHGRRQGAFQLAELHRLRPGPVGGYGKSKHI